MNKFKTTNCSCVLSSMSMAFCLQSLSKISTSALPQYLIRFFFQMFLNFQKFHLITDQTIIFKLTFIYMIRNKFIVFVYESKYVLHSFYTRPLFSYATFHTLTKTILRKCTLNYAQQLVDILAYTYRIDTMWINLPAFKS